MPLRSWAAGSGQIRRGMEEEGWADDSGADNCNWRKISYIDEYPYSVSLVQSLDIYKWLSLLLIYLRPLSVPLGTVEVCAKS